MIVIVKTVQVKADEEHFIQISAQAFLTNLCFPKFKTISESIDFPSSYTVYCSRGDEKTSGWASVIPMSHLSFVQCDQIKFRPKKNVKMKVSHSVVAVGIVVCVWGGGGEGGIHVMSHMT